MKLRQIREDPPMSKFIDAFGVASVFLPTVHAFIGLVYWPISTYLEPDRQWATSFTTFSRDYQHNVGSSAYVT